MDVRVISLGQPRALLLTLRGMFPQADVGVQPGVDVRDVSVHDLFSSGFVTHTTVHTLRKGRKWHHEHSSKGGIGLIHAVRLALAKDPSRPLLLLEDDCVIVDKAAVQRDVATLLTHMDEFDVASFGGRFVDASTSGPVSFLSKDWRRLNEGSFYLLHCVLYTPRARRRLSEYLTQPSDMQLDALYSSLSALGELRVLVTPSAARQSMHVSKIQEFSGGCLLCHFTYGPSYVSQTAVGILLGLLVVLATAYTAGRCRR